MKKLHGVVALATMILVSMTTTGTYAQAVEKGTVAVDAYYGFPNLLSATARNLYFDQTYDNFSVTGFGPAGIRGEYFINDHIAFGLDINYSVTNIKWTDQGYEEYDSNTGTYITRTYNYKISIPRLRTLAKFAYHFGSSDNFDWYAGAGIGYNSTHTILTTDNPTYTDYKGLGSIFVIPVSARIDFGGKYYFSKNIGAGFEVGLGGGPLASIGLCAKF